MPQKRNPAPVAAGNGAEGNVVADHSPNHLPGQGASNLPSLASSGRPWTSPSRLPKKLADQTSCGLSAAAKAVLK